MNTFGRRWISVLSGLGLMLGLLVVTATPAQALTNAEKCERAQFSPMVYGATGNHPEYNSGDVVRQKNEAGRGIQLVVGEVWGAGVSRPDTAAWAQLVTGSNPVGVNDRVKLQITKNGGDTIWAACDTWEGSGSYYSNEWDARRADTWIYVPHFSDPNYQFRACGYLPTPYGHHWFCTGWW